MSMSDVLKVGGGVALALLFMAVVFGLCYLVYISNEQTVRLRGEVMDSNAQAQETNNRITAENEASRREIEMLQANLSDLRHDQDLAVQLSLRLYEMQKAQENKTTVSQTQNITIIFPSGHATGTPRYNIPDSMKSIQCIDCFMPQIMCWRIDGKLHCNMPLGVNITTPSDDYAVDEDGTVVCDSVNSDNCYNLTLVDMHPL